MQQDSLHQLFTQWHLAGYCYSVFLVFVRMAATIGLMPGFGEQFVPVRVKLVIAVALAVAIEPLIAPPILQIPNLSGMVSHITGELLTGVLFGLWIRIIFLALNIAAGFCAQVLGITNIFDATLEPGGAPALSGFFSFTAFAIMASSGGNYFIFQTFVRTYDLVAFSASPDLGSANISLIEAGILAISLGLRIALPFLVIGFLINIGLGFVNRAMPQIPVFFVGQPIMIGVGLFLLNVLLPSIMFNWGEALRGFLMERL